MRLNSFVCFTASVKTFSHSHLSLLFLQVATVDNLCPSLVVVTARTQIHLTTSRHNVCEEERYDCLPYILPKRGRYQPD